MARLLDSLGQSVEIVLDGYQFPHPGEEWDANWLNVTVRVTCGNRYWERTDPALLTWEACSLVGWLKDLIELQDGMEREIGFIEPCLAFALRGDGETLQLAVLLALEFSENRSLPDQEDEIIFPVKGLDLKTFAKALEADLWRFPIRVMEKDGAAARHQKRHGCS